MSAGRTGGARLPAPEATTNAGCPACVGGKHACPPEDSGGPWGFADTLEAVADPGHEIHKEYSEWLGGFDLEGFSVEAAEARLREWFAPKRTRKSRGKR